MEQLEDVAMVGFPSQMLTSPKIRRETKNAKCQVNESTHVVCFLGFIFGVIERAYFVSLYA